MVVNFDNVLFLHKLLEYMCIYIYIHTYSYIYIVVVV